VIAPLLALAAVLAAAPAPVKIATLQLEGSGVPPAMAESATLLVPTEVRRARPDAQVISSEDVRSLLTHQKNRMVLGCGDDQSCMVDVGGSLGVDEIVGGRVGLLGSTFVLELRRVDVKGARNVASATRAVKSADALVGAVRSATGELYASAPAPMPGGEGMAGGAGGAGGTGDAGGSRAAIAVVRPADDDLPRPSVTDQELDFRPISYKGTGHRRVYDLVRGVIVGAKIPLDQERTEEDASLRLRTDWIILERGRRFRFRVRVDGKVGFDIDREKCDERGCAETEDVSKGEFQLATDLYAALRSPVEKGRF
jgi:hypothetical protein